MTRVFNVFAAVLAAGLLFTGLLLGFGNKAGGCGTPFDPADGASEACEVVLAEQREIPLALIGIGVSLGFALLFANGFAPIVRED